MSYLQVCWHVAIINSINVNHKIKIKKKKDHTRRRAQGIILELRSGTARVIKTTGSDSFFFFFLRLKLCKKQPGWSFKCIQSHARRKPQIVFFLPLNVNVRFSASPPCMLQGQRSPFTRSLLCRRGFVHQSACQQRPAARGGISLCSATCTARPRWSNHSRPAGSAPKFPHHSYKSENKKI